MPHSKTASFVATLPLKTSSSDEKELEARFNAAQNLYNAVLSESKKRLELVRNSEADQEAKNTPKKDKKLRSERFKAARAQKRYSEYDLHEFASRTTKASKWIAQKIDAQAVKTIATRAFKAAERMLIGNAKKVRFKGKGRYRSVEGKTNKQGIRFKDECLIWGKLKIDILLDKNDPVILHALNSPIKFCRIVSLSQRIHECGCQVKVKRDVVSAFLARSVTDDNLIMSSVLSDWGRLETVLRQA